MSRAISARSSVAFVSSGCASGNSSRSSCGKAACGAMLLSVGLLADSIRHKLQTNEV